MSWDGERIHRFVHNDQVSREPSPFRGDHRARSITFAGAVVSPDAHRGELRAAQAAGESLRGGREPKTPLRIRTNLAIATPRFSGSRTAVDGERFGIPCRPTYPGGGNIAIHKRHLSSRFRAPNSLAIPARSQDSNKPTNSSKTEPAMRRHFPRPRHPTRPATGIRGQRPFGRFRRIGSTHARQRIGTRPRTPPPPVRGPTPRRTGQLINPIDQVS